MVALLGSGSLLVRIAKERQMTVERSLMMAAAPPKPASLSYATTQITASFTGTPYTFSDMNIGAAASDRRIIVAVGTYDGAGTPAPINYVTVGGQATTLLVGASNSRNFNSLYITTDPFPSGTTANITVSVTGNYGTYSASTFNVTGLSSITPVATATSNNPSISGLKGGFILGFAACQWYYGPSGYATWSGATNLFYETGYPSASYQATAGYKQLTTSGSNSVSVSMNDVYEPVYIFASMR